MFAATSGGGVSKSPDGGESWTPANSRLASKDVYCLAYQPLTDIWYAGTYGHGVFYSLNMGENWKPMSSGIPNSYPYSYIQASHQGRSAKPGSRIRRFARRIFH